MPGHDHPQHPTYVPRSRRSRWGGAPPWAGGRGGSGGGLRARRRGPVTPVCPPSSRPVARRCLPAIHAKKGVIMVGNKTTYDDGHGNQRNVTELLEGAK